MSVSIIATTSSGEFEMIPSGSFIARCYKMIDVGTHTVSWGDEPIKPQRQVYLFWEILEDEDGEKVAMKDGRPFSVQNRYTLSTHPKSKLRQIVDTWRGKALTDSEAIDFDVAVLAGQYCRLQINHVEANGKTYANVTAVGFTKKKPTGQNEVTVWSVAEPNMEQLSTMPQWLQDKIAESMEMADRQDKAAESGYTKAKKVAAALRPEPALDEIGDEPINLDDIPF